MATQKKAQDTGKKGGASASKPALVKKQFPRNADTPPAWAKATQYVPRSRLDTST